MAEYVVDPRLTTDQLDSQIGAIQELINSLRVGETTTEWDRVARNAEELTLIKEKLQTRKDELTTLVERSRRLQKNKIDSAQKGYQDALDRYDRVVRGVPKTGDTYEKAVARVAEKEAALRAVDPGNALLPKSETAQKTETERMEQVAEFERLTAGGTTPVPRQLREGGVVTRPPGAKPPTAAKAAAGAVASSEWVETQLELRGLADTPENRKAMQAEYKSQKPAIWNDQVQSDFLARFPQFSYLFDSEVFGDSADQIKNIVVRAVTEKWFLYPTTAKAIIKRLVASTPYGIRSTTKQEDFDAKGLADQNAEIDSKVRELKDLYGQLGLDESTWRTLAKTAARNGLDDATTRANLFKTIYEQSPEGVARYDKAIKVLEEGKLGQDVRKVYRDYMLNTKAESVSEDIRAYTTGEKTLDDIRRVVQGFAKQAMPALANSIDQGLTIKQVADQYAAYAADILEVPVQSIDMSTAKFRKAFDGQALMSVGEWQKMLKTDPNYGWQYTTTANRQAMDVATAIARAFGAVK